MNTQRRDVEAFGASLEINIDMRGTDQISEMKNESEHPEVAKT